MPERTKKVLVEVKYRDLADLIHILQDEAMAYHNLGDYEELTLDQFTEWLLSMKGSVSIAQKPLTEILSDADLATISPYFEQKRKHFCVGDFVKVGADYA